MPLHRDRRATQALADIPPPRSGRPRGDDGGASWSETALAGINRNEMKMRNLLAIAALAIVLSPRSEALAPQPAVPGVPRIRHAIDREGATFTIERQPVALRYRWVPDDSGGGTISAARADRATQTLIARYQLRWVAPARLVASRMAQRGDTIILTQSYRVGEAVVQATLRGTVRSGSLHLDLAADKPLLDRWTATIEPAPDLVRQTMPYNPLATLHSAAAGLFASLSFDWKTSRATRLDSDAAIYLPRTDGRRNIVRERMVLRAAADVAATFPKAIWPRSRYYDHMAGRLVVDITTTEQFADMERKLGTLRDAGLSDCMVIVHVWQRAGYDNALPSTMPPNGFYGGQVAIQRIAALVRSMRCDFALHQNYIDYYPNADRFDRELAARDADGKLLGAWLNPTTKIQSFSARPRAFMLLTRPVADEIHQTLGTSASFIDVNSSFAPWQRVDMDAQEEGGGSFAPFLAGSKALFERMQTAEGGPVLGEGGAHFYWTGALDGVEADLASGPDRDARLFPLWVDFDLRAIHPLQQNYGMGYFERFRTGNFDLAPADRDIYRTQQIAFGHLPYHSGHDWGNPRLFVQEAGLAAPVARAYGNARATRIDYWHRNRWMPIETAFASASGRTVRIGYDNGLSVTANTDENSARDAAGRTIPRGGWSATGAGIEGGSVAIDRMRHDFMTAPGSFYADPRDLPGNWNGTQSGVLRSFPDLRTNGQTWIRCIAGRWSFLGYANRGSIDLEVRDTAIVRPGRLRSTQAVAIPGDSNSPGFWHVRLVSGQRYRSDVPCSG